MTQDVTLLCLVLKAAFLRFQGSYPGESGLHGSLLDSGEREGMSLTGPSQEPHAQPLITVRKLRPMLLKQL